MTKLLAWAKSNPLTLFAAGLALAGVILLGLVWWWGGSFAEAETKAGEQAMRIEGYKRTPVEIPPQEADGRPERLNIAVNQMAINRVKQAYGAMSAEADAVRAVADRRNTPPYKPMLDKLFPAPPDPARPYTAKLAFVKSVEAMLAPLPKTDGEWVKEVAHLPCLHAGTAASPAYLAQLLEGASAEYMRNHLTKPTAEALTPNERAKLQGFLRERLLGGLSREAAKVCIYVSSTTTTPAAAGPGADRTLSAAGPTPPPGEFPLQIDPWVQTAGGAKPTMLDLWEGQMNLWIMQALVEVIAKTNGDGTASGPGNRPEGNVMQAPIKRLIKIDVAPGSVGVGGNPGGMQFFTSSSASVSTGTGAAMLTGAPPPPWPAAPPLPMTPGPNPGDPPVLVPLLGPSPDPKAKVLDNFAVSPTGRTANALYDVRHARVSMIVDITRLQEFFANLASTKFLTVLAVKTAGVDEYAALREGYVYGTQDAMHVELLIEVVWLRRWTEQWMPEEVKQVLGFAPAAAGGIPASPTLTTPTTPTLTPSGGGRSSRPSR